MRCPNCHFAVPDGAQACPRCWYIISCDSAISPQQEPFAPGDNPIQTPVAPQRRQVAPSVPAPPPSRRIRSDRVEQLKNDVQKDKADSNRKYKIIAGASLAFAFIAISAIVAFVALFCDVSLDVEDASVIGKWVCYIDGTRDETEWYYNLWCGERRDPLSISFYEDGRCVINDNAAVLVNGTWNEQNGQLELAFEGGHNGSAKLWEVEGFLIVYLHEDDSSKVYDDYMGIYIREDSDLLQYVLEYYEGESKVIVRQESAER